VRHQPIVEYLEDMTSSEEAEINITFDIEHTEKQVKILNELKRYCH
jgi:hypothetical protein